jgi:hypothetical protein
MNANPLLDFYRRVEVGEVELPMIQGGPGSGNFGHTGRPGKRGGSGGKSGGGKRETQSSGMGKELGLSESQQKDLASLADSLIPKLEKYLDEGSPTCTVAANEIGKFLESRMDAVQYASGDFQDQGHWWVMAGNKQSNGLYRNFVVDFGDNISESVIRTGKITPKIIPVAEAKKIGYKAEEYLNRKKFIKEMQKQGYKSWKE